MCGLKDFTTGSALVCCQNCSALTYQTLKGVVLAWGRSCKRKRVPLWVDERKRGPMGIPCGGVEPGELFVKKGVGALCRIRSRPRNARLHFETLHWLTTPHLVPEILTLQELCISSLTRIVVLVGVCFFTSFGSGQPQQQQLTNI